MISKAKKNKLKTLAEILQNMDRQGLILVEAYANGVNDKANIVKEKEKKNHD